MKVLVTGASGFVGRHLAGLALEKKAEVWGTVLGENRETLSFQSIHCDITKMDEIEHAVTKSQPEIVFHLAAQSSATVSWQKPLETFQINVIGTLNVLEAIRLHSSKSKIVFVSSSECYGIINKETALPETTPLNPVSPYGMTKNFGEELCRFYSETFGIEYAVARFFNIIGPKQSPALVVSDWAKQTAEIEKEIQKSEILVGNLSLYRDFLDVRDAATALWLLGTKKTKSRAFNVCSGNPVQLKTVLETIISLSKKNVSYKTDSSKLRKIDVKNIFGSNALVKKETGWQPKISLQQSIKDTLEYWRKKTK